MCVQQYFFRILILKNFRYFIFKVNVKQRLNSLVCKLMKFIWKSKGGSLPFSFFFPEKRDRFILMYDLYQT